VENRCLLFTDDVIWDDLNGGYFADCLWLTAGAVILVSANSIKLYLHDLNNCCLDMQDRQLLRLLLTSCAHVSDKD